MLALAGLTALGLAVFCAGYIVRGWVEDERHRQIPEHPTLTAIRRGAVSPKQPSLRLVAEPPFDQDKESRAE